MKRKKANLSPKTTKYTPKMQRQLGGFLNCSDFAYAGRDTVNQAAKVAPGVIKSVINDLNAAATDRIN